MCGFAGFLSRRDIGDANYIEHILTDMGNAIYHRGPDSSGIWADRFSGVGFVHRRLAIVDLSSAGHQPMSSEDDRYVLIFNGEIYNHLTLRSELDSLGRSPVWRGHSDTETLLAGFVAWGVEATLARCIGMFAIALWDRRLKILTLARDRLGEKPLFYGWQNPCDKAVFVFGSELKALRAYPLFSRDVDRDALALFMRHNYIPAPYSIYRGVRKLPPGCILTVSNSDSEPKISSYWKASSVARSGMDKPFKGTDQEAVDELERLAGDAVKQQMISDVPLGAFLSGGIDSSAIVALMQSQSARPVKTFTIGFNEKGFNEAEHARAVANHLGTDHTELYVTSQEAMAVIPKLPLIYDEPFADSSQIPTFLISQMARHHVTVALSGDAGDELFGGYSRYLQADRVWRTLDKLPSFLRVGVSKAIRSVSVENWNRLAGPVLPFFPERKANVGDRAHKFAGLVGHPDYLSFYRRFVTHWPSPEQIVIGAKEPDNYFTRNVDRVNAAGNIEGMMLADTLTYLPDDILVKVDRAAMSVSLETRVPFLDHRVVEFAWRLPFDMKVREGKGKWALRQMLYRHVPRELIDRPKMGFGVPLGEWLRGPLRDWAESLLNTSRIRREGYFNPEMVAQTWGEHISGTRNWQYLLWDVLMFQAWNHNEANGV